jgi:cell division control protein 24
MQANAAVDRELRNEALTDLCTRVDDWKNHRVDHFGDLLLHGHFPVVTGKSDVQKEVRPPNPSTLTKATYIREIKATGGSKCKAALKSNLRPSYGKNLYEADESEFDSASSTYIHTLTSVTGS